MRPTAETNARRDADLVVEVDGRRIRSPGWYHQTDAFQAVFLASHDAVRAALPTDDLFPVRWFDGRAAVIVAALRYHAISGQDVTDGHLGTEAWLTPYAEVVVGALVTRKPAGRGVLLLRPSMPGVGGFVLQMPVTTREARDLGRVIFGMPKFVADMEFTESPSERSVIVSEDGAEVLALSVRPRGPVLTDHRSNILYSSLNGQLRETITPVEGHRQLAVGARGGRLRLGDHHPVGRMLGGLELAATPLMGAGYLAMRMVMPWGQPVGTARDYPGYTGADRPLGGYTVAYGDTGPNDQYELPVGTLFPDQVAQGLISGVA